MGLTNRTGVLAGLTVRDFGAVSVHPVVAGWQPMNLRALTLTPVR